MNYTDIASLATDMQQANTNLNVQMWGIKSMAQNQSNTIKELLSEVSPTNNASNNPEGTATKINTTA